MCVCVCVNLSVDGEFFYMLTLSVNGQFLLNAYTVQGKTRMDAPRERARERERERERVRAGL